MKEATSPTATRSNEVKGGPAPAQNDNSLDTSLRRERIKGAVTLRAFLVGILFTVGLAWANCWIATVLNVHSMGGIQMPFGAVFALLVLILFFNLPMRKIGVKPFTAPELLTIYAMTLFGGMLSTPGTDNQFMTMGSTLFYFQTPENGWANLFYQYVPSWFAPSWDGKAFNQEVIDKLYLGGLKAGEIPWAAWIPTLSAWGIFMLLCYGMLFFLSLMFRKQWVEREALAFPLIQLPLQMVDVDRNHTTPPSAAFWANRMMWLGFGLAAVLHILKGLYTHYPDDWPNVPLNAGGLSIPIKFTEKPWNAIPGNQLGTEVYLGAIGIAYLLTREVSFSFWFFYLFVMFQYAFAEMVGIPLVGLNKAGMMGRPEFILYQGVGGWVAMAAILAWTARNYIGKLIKSAFSTNRIDDDEPFSPRFVVFGFLLALIGLLTWSWFAGINVLLALVFLGVYIITSIVITRLVIEGGFLFPQQPYYTLEWMTNGMFGGAAIGAASLTKLSFLQANILVDTRTNVMPAFIHTMKIADEMRMDRQGLRRLLFCVVTAIVATMLVTFVATLHGLYTTQGGLAGYDWFTKSGPEAVLNTTKAAIDNIDNPAQSGFRPMTLLWTAVGAGMVWMMVAARSRFLWFPLHPLGYIMAPAYPITRLWFSFFLGWAIKSLIMKYGGSDTYANVRPFMIGLILGNLAAMVLWVLIGFYSGTQIKYWTG